MSQRRRRVCSKGCRCRPACRRARSTTPPEPARPMASIVTGVIVMLTLLVLAPLFSDLPKPVLAAIIIDAVVFGMMDVGEMRRLWRVKRVDFWIAVLAIIGVLSAGVLAGVVIGIVLSVGWLVYVERHPGDDRARAPAGLVGVPLAGGVPRWRSAAGLLVVRFDGGLTFVTAESLADGVEHRLRDAAEPRHRRRDRLRAASTSSTHRARTTSASWSSWPIATAGSLRLARVRGDVLSGARCRRGPRTARGRPRPQQRRPSSPGRARCFTGGERRPGRRPLRGESGCSLRSRVRRRCAACRRRCGGRGGRRGRR